LYYAAPGLAKAAWRYQLEPAGMSMGPIGVTKQLIGINAAPTGTAVEFYATAMVHLCATFMHYELFPLNARSRFAVVDEK
jgi:hypothetical protein